MTLSSWLTSAAAVRYLHVYEGAERRGCFLYHTTLYAELTTISLVQLQVISYNASLPALCRRCGLTHHRLASEHTHYLHRAIERRPHSGQECHLQRGAGPRSNIFLQPISSDPRCVQWQSGRPGQYFCCRTWVPRPTTCSSQTGRLTIKTETLKEPTITITKEANYDPATTKYTVLLLDPDVPSPDLPLLRILLGNFVHLIVSDVQPECMCSSFLSKNPLSFSLLFPQTSRYRFSQ